MIRFNEDGTITNVLTPEEDEAFVRALRDEEAYNNGAKENARKNAISMIKKNYPLKDIAEITKLSIKDLKKLVVK